MTANLGWMGAALVALLLTVGTPGAAQVEAPVDELVEQAVLDLAGPQLEDATQTLGVGVPWHECKWDPTKERYACKGQVGYFCYYEWTDDDPDTDPYDNGAKITYQSCGLTRASGPPRAIHSA